MRAQQWMWRALVLIALLNSGGIGYWSCCGQICRVSFWLQVCQDGCPLLITAPNPTRPNSQPALVPTQCDCHFVSVEVSPPPSVKLVIVEQSVDKSLLLDEWAVVLHTKRPVLVINLLASSPHLWNAPHGRRAPPSV